MERSAARRLFERALAAPRGVATQTADGGVAPRRGPLAGCVSASRFGACPGAERTVPPGDARAARTSARPRAATLITASRAHGRHGQTHVHTHCTDRYTETTVLLNCLCTTNARANSRRFTLAAHAHPLSRPQNPWSQLAYARTRGGRTSSGRGALGESQTEREQRQTAAGGSKGAASLSKGAASQSARTPSRRPAGKRAHACACSASKSSIRA